MPITRLHKYLVDYGREEYQPLEFNKNLNPAIALKFDDGISYTFYSLINWEKLSTVTFRAPELDDLPEVILCTIGRTFDNFNKYAGYKIKSWQLYNQIVSADTIIYSTSYHIGAWLHGHPNDNLWSARCIKS